MRKAVEETRSRGVAEPDEVAAPGLSGRQLLGEAGLLVDREAVDEVHRPEHVVPRVRGEQLGDAGLDPREVVDLEPELHRQAAALRLENGVNVVVEIVVAALQHPGDLPEVLALAEVVDVVAEPDLVDPGPAGLLDVRLSAVGRVGPKRRVVGPSQVHVVVDEHEEPCPQFARNGVGHLAGSRRSLC